MPNVNLSPIGNTQFSYDDGSPADGSLLWTYIAGSTTPLTTYTSSSGLIAQTNPIVLNSLGLPTIGEVFLIEGLTYDIVWEDKPIFPATHGAVLKTFEDIDGINDNATTTNQWISSGVTPTYISASSFSLQGDQTTEFHNGRMAQFLVTSGTVYGKIVNSVFAASLTTVTVLMLEGGALDGGLTTANLSFLRADHSALPNPIEFIRSTVVANALTTPLWDRAYGEIQDWTGVVAITALPNAPREGTQRQVYPAAGATITNGGNISVQGGVSSVAAAGDKWTITAITTTTFYVEVSKRNGNASNNVLPGFLNGLVLSPPGASATMPIALGVAADSTNSVMLNLSTAFTKTTAAWAVGTGNGGKLSAAAIANSTWYYWFLIYRSDTGVVDIGFDVSPTSPTLPANYTHYRYIGANVTNGSAQWTKVTQVDDEFYLDTPVLDFTGAGSTTAALLTCTVPRGRKVKPFFNILTPTNPADAIYISDPDNANIAPSVSVAPLGQGGGGGAAGGFNVNPASCWTNTSAQIRHRELTVTAIAITTLGWIDKRDRG